MTLILITVIVFFAIKPFVWQAFAVVVATGILQGFAIVRNRDQGERLGIDPTSMDQRVVMFMGLVIVMIALLGLMHWARYLVRRAKA
ncbi:MAG: Copper resistance protein D [Roseibaca calidilacus]|jgi:hypothetical protein|uniref:Copper resistance protein D n=1 Tax=Roseibaca calidilacus TaxID=1666912 RepID=A0A0N8K6V9_9RHOB|nr:hypothetical protein [Roseibaca calidilacus]KPP90025.1 MAG: Copper resistance protein D [Roseibaca calidilacus]CUX81130.1 hypothetical protein Ga0058931_1569 [Roseibaca calidilacus]